jgi:hypothetical protein
VEGAGWLRRPERAGDNGGLPCSLFKATSGRSSRRSMDSRSGCSNELVNVVSILGSIESEHGGGRSGEGSRCGVATVYS